MTPIRHCDIIVMMTSEYKVLIRMPRELAAKLRLLAEKERRSFNAQSVKFLEDAVEAYEKENGPLGGETPERA